MFGEGREGGWSETLRGALVVLAVGLVLGISYNTLARAGKPPRGLPWIAGPEPMVQLESLQPGAAPTTGGSEAEHVHSEDEPAEAHSADPRSPASSPATPAAQSPGAAPPGSAATSQTTTPAPAPATAADLPVVPDIPGPIELEIASLKKLYDADAALIVDGRDAEEYAAGHIAGAIHLSYNDALAEPERVQNLDSGGRPIIVYCSSEHCDIASQLADFMVDQGRRRVLVFRAGFEEWQAAGYPIARGSSPGARP
jgi:rhodanese-related sulfurtransferase